MRKRSDGFTLVELMVVILVIGILVAVAVPVFSAARTKAKTNTCQANQRTWAGVVEQVKGAGDEPDGTTGYKQLALGGSAWYAKANGTYLKSVPKCPTADGTSYWVYETPAGGTGNGAMVACGGATEVTQTSTEGHLVYAKPSAAHRYWRILATSTSYVAGAGAGEEYVNAFAQISFKASGDGSGTTDLCIGRDAFASTEWTLMDCYAWEANDGSDGSKWHTSADQYGQFAWWGVDLCSGSPAGQPSEVHSVQTKQYASSYAQSFALQWSDDDPSIAFKDKTWHTQSTFRTNEVHATLQTYKNL